MAQGTAVRTISISVNNRPVTMTLEHGKSETTGAAIKSAAIAQQIAIRMDHVLLEKKGGEYRPVGDNEAVIIHPNQEFRAVAPDDTSQE